MIPHCVSCARQVLGRCGWGEGRKEEGMEGKIKRQEEEREEGGN